MPGMRDDYILRLIDQLREFVDRAVNLREARRLDEALVSTLEAQEKLFGRPFAEVAPLPIDEQVRLLLVGESGPTGRFKCRAYALLLREAGRVYRARGQEDFARGAWTLGLHVALAAAAQPEADREEGRALVGELAAMIPREALPAPTAELLERFEGPAAG